MCFCQHGMVKNYFAKKGSIFYLIGKGGVLGHFTSKLSYFELVEKKKLILHLEVMICSPQ